MSIKHEVKVGTFILISLALLAYIIMWLHKFDMSSYLKISARFKDVGTLGIGSSVLYRGVKAGTVTDIVISKDQEYAIVKINITNKSIHIYEGSLASIVDKGFTGTKALAITPPDNIKNRKCLKDGDIIEGQRSFTLDELQKTLTRLSDEITFEDIVRDIHTLLKNSNRLTAKLDKLIENSEIILNKQSGKKFNAFMDNTIELCKTLKTTSKNLNRIIGDRKLVREVKTSISSTNRTMKTFSKVADKAEIVVDKTSTTIDKLDKTVSKIDNTINNPDLDGSLRGSMEKFSDILTDVKEITGDEKVKQNLKEALEHSSESIKRLNCFSKELSNTLSKRFLIPRMLLGRPGKNMTHCSSSESLELNINNDG